MNSLRQDREYQNLRKQFRILIDADRPANLSDQVMTELFRTHPEAHWVKFGDGRMYAINEQYSREFGVPLIEYIDNLDDTVWDEDVAEGFSVNDRLTLAMGTPMTFTENIKTESEEYDLIVKKWPMKINVNGTEVPFVAGKSCGRRCKNGIKTDRKD